MSVKKKSIKLDKKTRAIMQKIADQKSMAELRLFGMSLALVADRVQKSMGAKHVAEYLITPIPILENKTVIQIIWDEGEGGCHRIVAMLQGTESGFAV